MGKKWTLSRLYDKAAHRNFIHSRRITWAWNEWIECGYNWRHTTSYVGDDSYTIYQEFIRLFKPSWLGGAWGRGSGGYSGTYAANERKSKCSKQVQCEKTHAHWVNFNRERLRVRTIAWFCVRERERERKALGQADKHDGNPQHISGNTNNNSNKEQPHRQAVHVMHHLEARIRCSTSSPSTSAAAAGAASSFTCLTLSHFFALLEVVAGCSECCAFFLEFGAMTRH